MSRPGGPRCDPERVFELADGGLSPEAECEARAHVNRCPECRELYEDELRLSARIGSLEVGPTRSVCQEVAMALPTRLVGGRIVWAGLALLVAFGLGAVVDLLIAGVVLSVSRRRAREA